MTPECWDPHRSLEWKGRSAGLSAWPLQLSKISEEIWKKKVDRMIAILCTNARLRGHTCPKWIASAVGSFDSSFANVCRELPLKSQGSHPLNRLVVTYAHLNSTCAPSYRWSVGASKLGSYHLWICSHDIFWPISFLVPFIWMGNLRRSSHSEFAMRGKKKGGTCPFFDAELERVGQPRCGSNPRQETRRSLLLHLYNSSLKSGI